MMRVICPHLDDAVLSLGQYMATRPGDLEVVTVLAGVPPVGLLTDYDRARGFTTSAESVRARLDEDADALNLLGAGFARLRFFDQQYRPTGADPGFSIAGAIKEMYSPKELLFAPLGIGHPDHVLVADAARYAVMQHSGEVPVGLLLYEELPSRVLNPEQVVERLEVVRAEGWSIDPLPWPLEQGGKVHREAKAGAIACYKSQFPDGADDPCLLVPERVWRVTR